MRRDGCFNLFDNIIYGCVVHVPRKIFQYSFFPSCSYYLYHSFVSWNLLIKQIMINTSLIYEYVRRINSCCSISLCCLSFLILMLILNGYSFLLIHSFKTPPPIQASSCYIYFFLGKLLLNSHGGDCLRIFIRWFMWASIWILAAASSN